MTENVAEKTPEVSTSPLPLSSGQQGTHDLHENVFLTTVDSMVNWCRKSSVWPLTFGLACCAIEMMAVGASKYDLDRFGSGPFRATPRQADLMVVAGTVTHKMAPRVKRLYDQMPEPKYVIAMGACTINGGPYYEFGYHVVQGVDLVIPVDVYMPGCPPRPEAFLEALFRIQDLIKKERILVDRTRLRTKVPVYDGTPIFRGIGDVTEEDKAKLADETKRNEMMKAFERNKKEKYKVTKDNVTCAAWIADKKKAEQTKETSSEKKEEEKKKKLT